MTYAIIGLDEDLADAIRKEVRSPEHRVMVYPTLPNAYTDKGTFKVEHPSMEGLWVEPEATLYYSYFPDSSGIRKAMAFGRQPTWPPVRNTILHDDKDLSLLRVGGAEEDNMPRGYIPAGFIPNYSDDTTRVFKQGNEHCGGGKDKVSPLAKDLSNERWTVSGYGYIAKKDTLVEPFIEGDSYRVLVVGGHYWVIKYESRDWRKNVDGTQAVIEPDMTHHIMIKWARHASESQGLPVLGADFILDSEGETYILEVNCYPEIPEVAKPAFISEAVSFFKSGT